MDLIDEPDLPPECPKRKIGFTAKERRTGYAG
jgi:hypothetical protein